MDMSKIEDEEILYRAIKESYPDALTQDGLPTAALFLDEKGLSVERDGEREEAIIIQALKDKFPENEYHACVKISALTCRQIETYPIPTHNKKNIYHAEIHDSPEKKQIDILKAIQLAHLCQLVYE